MYVFMFSSNFLVLLSNSCGMMFQTTESGKVRALKFPFNPEGSLTDEATEYSFSESPIRQIQFSLNGRYLFSAGEDGTLWIHKIHDKEGRVKTKDWEFSDEVSLYIYACINSRFLLPNPISGTITSTWLI